MQSDPTTKRCFRCDTAKPLSAFNKDRSRSDGVQTYCRPCHKVMQNAHPEQRQAKSRRYWGRNTTRVRILRERRRFRLLAAFVEDVAVEVLVERDHDRCGICGKAVPVSERSVDHILPLSKGGLHSYANTRLTHLRCNVKWYNNGAAQLRMVG